MRRAVVLLVLGSAACRAAPIPESRRFPAGTVWEGRHVLVDDTRIRYIDTGADAGKPPVVLIHGLGASIYSWRKTIAPVAVAGFRVVAFDNRGFGFSARPRSGYSNAAHARLVLALMDSLGIAEAVLVGHSMGGAIAAEAALAAPDRVRGLVLIDAAGYGLRYPLLLRVAGWPLVGPLAAALRSRSWTARLLKGSYGDASKVTEADVDQYYAPVAEPDYGRALRGVAREFRFDALRGRLGAIEIPTLVLWGERDRIIPLAVGRRLAAELPRVAFIVMPGVGHAAPEEAPDAVNHWLTLFLTEGLPRPPDNLARGGSRDYDFINHLVEINATWYVSSRTSARYALSPQPERSLHGGVWREPGWIRSPGARVSTSS